MRFKLSCRASLICFCGAALTLAAREETDQGKFVEQVKHHYTKWDSNHDHRISMDEVDSALASSAANEEEGAALISLRCVMRDKGIKTFTLEQLVSNVAFKPKYESMYEAALRQPQSHQGAEQLKAH